MKGKKSEGSATNGAANGAANEDFEFEFLCTTCNKEDIVKEASNFCLECNSNLCPECVNQHRKFPTMRNHKILGKSSRKYLDQEVKDEENFLECENHSGKMVDMYCPEHDQVWCGGCMATYHRTCSNVLFISEASKNILKSKQLKDTKSNLKKAIKEFKQLMQKVDMNMDSLASQHGTVLTTIKDFRDQLNQLMDELEAKTIRQLKDVYSRNSVQIGEDRLRCEALLKTMSQLDRELDKPLSPTNSESDIFTYIQRTRRTLQNGEMVHPVISRNSNGHRIKFVIDPSIWECLKKMQDRSLGHFVHKYRLNDIDVKLEDDTETCVINGATVVNAERILIADWTNNRLKLLDKFFSVIDNLKLDAGPNDVCHTGTNEAMVSLPGEKSLQVLKIDPKLSLGKKYDIGTECRGMEYWAGELYVICAGLDHEAAGHIRIYDNSIRLLRAIEHDHLDKSIFKVPMRIALSHDGSNMYVTDGEKGLITLKRSGEMLPTFEDSSMKWPWGICVDNHDQLFVCGSSSNNVLQIQDNAKIGVVLTAQDGIKDPMAILFFPIGSRLIVTTNKSDYIKVFTPM